MMGQPIYVLRSTRQPRVLRSRTRAAATFRTEAGFSLLEMLIVVSLMMIAAAIVFENVTNAVRTMRLQESAVSYANLLQQARVRAVQDDKYYSVLVTNGNGSNPPTAFVDIAGTGVYASGDPIMIFASGVTPMPFGSGPSLSNLESQFLPPGAASLASVNTTSPGPT